MQILKLDDRDKEYLRGLIFELAAIKDEINEFTIENGIGKDLLLAYIEYLETER